MAVRRFSGWAIPLKIPHFPIRVRVTGVIRSLIPFTVRVDIGTEDFQANHETGVRNKRVSWVIIVVYLLAALVPAIILSLCRADSGFVGTK